MRAIPKQLLLHSKSQRKAHNPWEYRLWYHLRGKGFNGYKFKRQVRIGEYIVDFSCNKQKLVIELDGGTHNKSGVKINDEAKENYLQKEGYRVLRFWNSEVMDNINGVLSEIQDALL
ncbi:MAG TPA: endonuclease domain-containing protein [Patescibacteria group bacterium]|nr:endonuclease domain-containing protein [Patescibacteria group bacterium]